MSTTRAGWGLLLLALALYLWHGWSFGLCLQDDAFISLRYARNLAEGSGLVYNPGEHVEGFTNFLWTLAMAGLFLLGGPPVKGLQVLALLSGILALWAVFDLARTLAPGRRLAGGAAAMIVALLPFFVAESVMGLETALFAALAALGMARYFREVSAPASSTSPPWPLSGLILALAALTRPEGLLVAGLAGLNDLWGCWRRRRWPERGFWTRWMLFGLPVAGLFLFRWFYYHDIVPNTFHAKVGGGLAALLRGVSYTGDFALRAFPLLLAAAAGVWVLLRRRTGSRRPWLALAVPLIFIAYVAWVGGDYKPTFRFFATPALFLAAWAGVGLAGWIEAEDRLSWRPSGLALVLIAATGGLLFGLGGPAREFARWRAQVLPVHRAAGRWLGAAYPAGTWIATGNAGVLPYESKLPTIDMYGLCDRHIAARQMPRMGDGPPGHEKGDGAYVLSRAPRLILFMRARFTEQPITPAEIAAMRKSVSERELWADPLFHQSYTLRSARLPGFYFNYFERSAEP